MQYAVAGNWSERDIFYFREISDSSLKFAIGSDQRSIQFTTKTFATKRIYKT